MTTEAEHLQAQWGRVRWGRFIPCLVIAGGLPLLGMILALGAIWGLPHLEVFNARKWDAWCEAHGASYDLDWRETWIGRVRERYDLPDDIPGLVYGVDYIWSIYLKQADDAAIEHVVSECPELRTVELEHPALTERGYRRLAGAKMLDELIITCKSLPPEALGTLRNQGTLAFFGLTGCRLKGMDLSVLATMPKLYWVELTECDLTGTDMRWLREAGKVGWLNLDKCGADDAALAGLGKGRSLAGLDLSNNNFSDEVMAEVGPLTRLRELDLSGNPMTGTGLAQLKGLAELRTLVVDGVPITDEGLAAMPGFPLLEELKLDSKRLTDAGVAAMPVLPNLKRLEITEAVIGNAGLVAIGRCKSLEYLTVDGALVTDEGMGALDGLGELRGLQLRGARLSAAGLRHVPRLVGLDLTGARLEPGALAGLAGKHIEGLVLTDARLQGADLANLARLQGLKSTRIDSGFDLFVSADSETPRPANQLRRLTLSGVMLDKSGLAALSKVSVEVLALDGCGLTDEVLAAYVPAAWPTNLNLTGNPIDEAGVEALLKRHLEMAPDQDLVLSTDLGEAKVREIYRRLLNDGKDAPAKGESIFGE